ncbi:MAG TPA: hypothetical protein VH370_26905 [Humisphaera sp.]|nr:hypothetical protein [Humisphaera sp.]
MILGIGFIMVAAMFPVAIKQTQLTGQESNAATLSSEAANMIEKFSALRIPPSGTLMPSGYQGSTYFFPPNGPPTNIPPGSAVRRGRVYSFRDDRFADTKIYPNGSPVDPNITWQVVSGNLVSASDPRMAWIPLYRRDQVWDPTFQNPNGTFGNWVDSPFAEIILFAVQARNHSAYSLGHPSAPNPWDRIAPDLRRYAAPNFQPPATNDTLMQTSGGPANPPPAVLEPALYNALISPPQTFGGPQTIRFFPPGGLSQGVPYTPYAYPTAPDGDGRGEGRLAEGCYAVVSDDAQAGIFNGAMLRLGRFTGNATFEIAPGSEVIAAASTIPQYQLPINCLVFVVGRGYRYFPGNGSVPAHGEPSAGFDGGPQDIAVYASYVRVK